MEGRVFSITEVSLKHRTDIIYKLFLRICTANPTQTNDQSLFTIFCVAPLYPRTKGPWSGFLIRSRDVPLKPILRQ